MNTQAVVADEALVAQLKQIVGNDYVLTEEKDRDFFSTDLSGRDREIAAVVIQPGTTEELSAGVEAAVKAGLSIVARGGGMSKMIGASTTLELHNRELVDHLIAHETMPMAFTAVWNQDVEGVYKSISCPLMIMCSKDDVLWPLFERAAEMRPDARQCIVGGADYQPDNDPDSVVKGLLEFYADLA